MRLIKRTSVFIVYGLFGCLVYFVCHLVIGKGARRIVIHSGPVTLRTVDCALRTGPEVDPLEAFQ